MLKAQNLCFGGQNMPQHCLNFSVDIGQILMVMGPSGIGKTTLLNIIAGFVLPVSGQLSWQEKDLLSQPVWQRPISFLFQENNLFHHLTCMTNLAIGLHPSGKLTQEQKAHIQAVAADLQIEGILNRMPETLSGGQQQRVALARALIRNDPLILLDEPFSALDQDNRVQAQQLIRRIASDHKRALIVISHQIADAEPLEAECLDMGKTSR